MQTFIEILASQPLVLLFVVIGLGYVGGSIRVFGFSLGPAAVLFAGILLGAIDPRLRIPDLVYVIGLVLFVYTVGLASGPTFFSSFGGRAIRANLIALAAIALAGLLTFLGIRLFALEPGAAVGVFSGSLTNTPALAATIETAKSLLLRQGIPAGQIPALLSGPVIGYGLAYPFGVIGVLLIFSQVGRYWSVLVPMKEVPRDERKAPSIYAKTYRVVNPGIIGKTVSIALSHYADPGFVFSRLRRGKETSLVYPETVFQEGDLIAAVGGPDALERARLLLGEEAREEITTGNRDFEIRRIEVSDKRVVGKAISDLDLQQMLDATITRIRRGDEDFVPTAKTILERGDRVRVVTWAGNVDRVVRFFGDSVRSSTEMDFLSLSLGIVLGTLLGLVPLPLPGGRTFTLGFAGGPLIVGLVLGRIQRSGRVTWTMPFAVNMSLRQVGLALFLAGIGTKAGDGLLTTLAAGGWKLALVGAAVTTLVSLFVVGIGARALRLSFPAAMGMMSGIQTQPACLAFANERSASDTPNIWYAMVYPVSMIAKIVVAQVLVEALL
jgi:putative transport protein